ncbi:MAG TPA: hypothetical protein VHO72_04780 [Bacteroidales bacterium]|nr:hypothetical protein [Bacteroidales bacterium]
MKKILLSLSIILISVAAFAQQDSILRSKKGVPILPQKGDWAIGADAVPYLNYLGNIFNNTSGNSLKLDQQTLYGRYFIADNAAIRLLILINKGSSRNSLYVQDDAAIFADPLSRAQTTDYIVEKFTQIGFDLGYQKFRGYGRLRGFYGAHFGFGVTRNNNSYNYGNPMSIANSAPTSIDWEDKDPYHLSNRILEWDRGYEYGLNLGLIAGVEYYFMPKVCIGGEITLSASHSWKTQGNSKYEHLNGSVVEEYDIAESPKGRTGTNLYTQRPANFGAKYDGSLYLMFHF